jgi:hypothetical protein
MKPAVWILVAVASFTAPVPDQAGPSIQGVWRIEEIKTSGVGGTTIGISQPSLYIFTKTHYSVIRVLGDSPRKRLADDNKATAEELLAVYVSSFAANAGTYELARGGLTLRPTIAKDPGTMVPGVYMRFTYKVEGNSLFLVENGTSWSGAATNPPTVKLVRLE